MSSEQETFEKCEISNETVDELFYDFESRNNIVGLFDLLLKIDQRVNPHLYD